MEIVVSEIIRKFKTAQRIALSAVIGNPEDFKKWMADEIVYNTKRIIPLNKGIFTHFGLLNEGKILSKNIPIRKKLYNFEVPKTDRGKAVRYNNTIELVKHFVNEEKQCIIFTNGREHAENLAISLAIDVKNGGYKIDKVECEEISQILDDSIEEKTKFSKNLIGCTQLGVSFHHAGLQINQRTIIENAFVNKKLKVLVATSTLEQGVNLPANVVIISDCFRWNGYIREYEFLPTNNVLNMMGRAGRPEYHTLGEAILIENNLTDGQLSGRYIVKKPEKVLSQLRNTITRRKHLNGIIASNKIIPVQEIFSYLKTTLWFTIYEYEFEEFNLKREILSDISYLMDNGFIKKSELYYIPTEFGKAVSDSCIDCETGLLFLRASQKIIANLTSKKDIHPWSIFQLLLLSHEVGAYRPYDNNSEGLAIATQFEGKGLLLTEIPKRKTDEEIKKYSIISLAAYLLCDWIDEKPMNEIISKYPELRDADFYDLGDVLEWLGDALVKIAILNDVPKGITDKILIYCNRVVEGVKEELLEYFRIEGIRRKTARTIFNASFSYSSLKDLDHKTLSKLVGPGASKKIRDHFERIKKEGEEPIFDEEEIYDEVKEIVTEGKQIAKEVENLEKNELYLNKALKEGKHKERCKKIRRFCENELTWIHSDSKFFRFFTNHGVPHSSSVFNLINQLLNEWELKKGEKKLSEYEYFLLAVCSWCHDLGMLIQKGENYDDIEIVIKARKEHAQRIIPYLDQNYLTMGLSGEIEKSIVGQICSYHSSNLDIDNVPENQTILYDGKPNEIRNKLLSSLLRLSDALDATKNRLPLEENRKHPLVNDITKKEYRKHEIVHEVIVSSEKGVVFVQIVIKKDGSDDIIYKEVEEKLNEEFDSVKNILLDYGINIKKIEFIVVRI